jgi:alpha-D-ribose 1-methylphosphonate 5-triphosphate diphosphatase
MNDLVLFNARVVTPTEVLEEGRVAVRDGRIAEVRRAGAGPGGGRACRDAEGGWLMPGLVDLHNDALEREIEPRPRAVFPLPLALFAFESRLVSLGITTIFHSLSFMEGRAGMARREKLEAMVRELARLENAGVIRHRLHARYEIVEPAFAELLTRLLEQGQVHLVSFMDHTPGQGQFRRLENYVNWVRGEYHLGENDIEQLIRRIGEQRQAPETAEALTRVMEAASRAGVPMASHDDDTEDKVAALAELGVGLSEFPVELTAAQAAFRRGLRVAVGAPNLLLGGSNTGNMRARDAIEAGAADILCSDYHAPAMLPALFALAREGVLALPQAVRLATLNPAQALRLGEELGSLEEGKLADLLLVVEQEGFPVVRAAWVGGRLVYEREVGNAA